MNKADKREINIWIRPIDKNQYDEMNMDENNPTTNENIVQRTYLKLKIIEKRFNKHIYWISSYEQFIKILRR